MYGCPARDSHARVVVVVGGEQTSLGIFQCKHINLPGDSAPMDSVRFKERGFSGGVHARSGETRIIRFFESLGIQ